jgi:hypothetical protein
MNVVARPIILLMGVTAVLASACPAVAQSTRPPRDPTIIQRKVQRSADLQRQALENLSDPARAGKLARSAYTDLKSAQDDMIMNASNSKYPDPLLDLSTKKAQQALGLVQTAGDILTTRNQWNDPAGAAALAGVRSRLQQAVQITDTILATGF